MGPMMRVRCGMQLSVHYGPIARGPISPEILAFVFQLKDAKKSVHEPKKISGVFQDFQGPFSQFSRTKNS